MKLAAAVAALLMLSGCLATESVFVGVSSGTPRYYRPHPHHHYHPPVYGPRYWGPPPPRYAYPYGYRVR